MENIVELLTQKKLTLSSAESLTGGMFASNIVNISGASKVFVGGLVTYQDVAKEKLLDGKDILAKYGAVSEQMATNMAIKVQSIFDSDIAISFTGNAGPGRSEDKDVGLVYSCIVIFETEYNYCDHLKGSRDEIRNECVKRGIERIVSLIKSK